MKGIRLLDSYLSANLLPVPYHLSPAIKIIIQIEFFILSEPKHYITVMQIDIAEVNLLEK